MSYMKERPKMPTDTDKRLIAQMFARKFMGENYTPDELEELEGHMRYCAYFPQYITDCPGYAGEVWMIVWSGSPTFFDVVTRSKYGELQIEPRENGS